MQTLAESRNFKKAFGITAHESALIGITIFWGATFLIIHTAMRYSSPFFFVGCRFMTAGLLSLIVFRRTLAKLTWLELRAGIAIGSMICVGYGLQTAGLQTISSSESAFITAMYILFVPLLQWVVLRNPPKLMNLVGILFAFVGLILLAGLDTVHWSMGKGEVLTLLADVAIAAEIILISKFSRQVDVRRVTVVQLLAAGLIAFLIMPFTKETIPAFSWVWFSCAIGMAIGSLVAQLAMNWAQKAVSPTRATVIYSSEALWGGIVGWLAGDRLSISAIAGAVLILLGVVVSELKLAKSI